MASTALTASTAADKCAGHGMPWSWTRYGRTQPRSGGQSYRGELRDLFQSGNNFPSDEKISKAKLLGRL